MHLSDKVVSVLLTQLQHHSVKDTQMESKRFPNQKEFFSLLFL